MTDMLDTIHNSSDHILWQF